MGVPHAAVVSFLKNKDNRIEVNFAIEGDLNNPRFTLNEAFATRIASTLAENLGASIRQVVEGVGDLGQKGVEAAGEAAKGGCPAAAPRRPEKAVVSERHCRQVPEDQQGAALYTIASPRAGVSPFGFGDAGLLHAGVADGNCLACCPPGRCPAFDARHLLDAHLDQKPRRPQ